MKTLRLIILFFFVVLTSCGQQNNAGQKTQSKEDSLTKVILAQQDSMVRAFLSRRPDTKDSAWVTDFNGNTTWNSRSKSYKGKPYTIIDSLTKNYYVLDSSHKKVTAYDNSKKMIWQTEPRKEAKLGEYRHKDPTITYFKIGENSRHGNGEKVIHINYSNSQFGYLNLNSGKFHPLGQD